MRGSEILLERYLNAQVTVFYNPSTGVQDQGRITYIDEFWLELTKEKGEVLLIPAGAIRIVKVIDSPQLQGDAGMLLRAADTAPEHIRKQLPRE